MSRTEHPRSHAALAARTIYRLDLTIDRALDLRDAQLGQALSLTNAPQCFLDKSVARATANFLRATTPVQAVLVPSVAFLDQLERCVLALFLEKLPADPTGYVRSVQVEGPLQLGGESGA